MTDFSWTRRSVVHTFNAFLICRKFDITECIIHKINFRAVRDSIGATEPDSLCWEDDPYILEDQFNAHFYRRMGYLRRVSDFCCMWGMVEV